MTRDSSSPEALFWAHVDVDGPFSELMGNKCWVWTASTNGKAGYGRFEVSSDWVGGACLPIASPTRTATALSQLA